MKIKAIVTSAAIVAAGVIAVGGGTASAGRRDHSRAAQPGRIWGDDRLARERRSDHVESLETPRKR